MEHVFQGGLNMNNFKKMTAVVVGSLVMTTGMSVYASEAVTPAFATIEKGEIMGYSENGVYKFLGIPYGTAERFEQPVEAEAWNDILNCLNYGEVSPQDRTLNTSFRNVHEFATPSLDDMCANENTCLNLNVWTTSLESDAKKPVIVFMHGGGLSNGSASELESYDGKYLAEYADCVFVSVNARLNYLGYLDVSAYGDESYAYSGNNGLADMVLSLEWVNKNIETFGGDPENVTLVGQSGGGQKVTSLAALPATEGLFDKVFIMSGSPSEKTKEDGQAETAKLVEYLGLTEDDNIIQTLKDMPYEELYNACQEAGVAVSSTVDGDFFPEPWYNSETGELSEYAKTRTYMVTSTLAETIDTNATLVIGRDYITDDQMGIWKYNLSDEEAVALVEERLGDKTEAAIAAFQEAYPLHTDVYDVLYASNRARHLKNALATASNDVTVYNAVVAYELPWFGGNMMQHSGDIPFWFHSIDNLKYQILGDEENAYKVMDCMASALAAFAATGNPSTDELSWTPFTMDKQNTMVFDTECYEKVNLDTELMDILYGEQ